MKTIATTKIEEVENDNNPRLWRSIEHAIMKRHVLLNRCTRAWLAGRQVLVPVGQAAQAQGNKSKDLVPPIVFQAAGPTADSIQSTVDAFRAALGDTNNGNNHTAARQKRSPRDQLGRRQPRQSDTTTPPVTPFNAFLNTRGGQFTTPGIGLSSGSTIGGPGRP